MRDKACKFSKNRGEGVDKIWGKTHDKSTGIFSRDGFRAFAGLRPAFRDLRPASRALLPASRACGQRPQPTASVHSLRPAFGTCGQRSQPAASVRDLRPAFTGLRPAFTGRRLRTAAPDRRDCARSRSPFRKCSRIRCPVPKIGRASCRERV